MITRPAARRHAVPGRAGGATGAELTTWRALIIE
jgi:hypothetical protein